MKIMTLLGTRPEIIRLSLILQKLDKVCDHVLVHTGQNYDPNLSDIFFEQLGLREPDHFLQAAGAHAGRQIGEILARSEQVMSEVRPDRLLILGDTNSCLAAIMAKRLGIPVYHMEAGNRCYDQRVPEEVNRRVVDHCSDVHMPYTERSRANLLAEGIAPADIYVTGNPILEVLNHYRAQVGESGILDSLKLTAGEFFLVTLHRAENVDDPQRFSDLLSVLSSLSQQYDLPVILSTHPRTRQRMEQKGLDPERIQCLPPFGFFDFVALEKSARCVLSDSGTVQEECCLLGTPNVTLRDVTERPETIEQGSNLLGGANPETIERAVAYALQAPTEWSPPPEYLRTNVSDTVTRILLSYRR